jgi:hypothetical protein
VLLGTSVILVKTIVSYAWILSIKYDYPACIVLQCMKYYHSLNQYPVLMIVDDFFPFVQNDYPAINVLK